MAYPFRDVPPQLLDTPRKSPPCVCKHTELTHSDDGRCVHPDCACIGYWPDNDATKAVRPFPPGHTRPVAG
jgi:hypothetical protein